MNHIWIRKEDKTIILWRSSEYASMYSLSLSWISSGCAGTGNGSRPAAMSGVSKSLVLSKR